MRCLLAADCSEAHCKTDCDMLGSGCHAVHAVVQLALHVLKPPVFACDNWCEVLMGLLVLCSRCLPGTEYGHDMMWNMVGKLGEKLPGGQVLQGLLLWASCNNCCFEQESNSSAVAGMLCLQSELDCNTQLTLVRAQVALRSMLVNHHLLWICSSKKICLPWAAEGQ